MSIPDRLWRVVRGHWGNLEERAEEALRRADAYEELAKALKGPGADLELPPSTVTTEPARTVPPTTGVAPPPAGNTPRTERDPLSACYELLRAPTDAGLPVVEEAYQARLAELKPEDHAPGSAARAVVEARRKALDAAYERLRDVLNPTETRFERLEF